MKIFRCVIRAALALLFLSNVAPAYAALSQACSERGGDSKCTVPSFNDRAMAGGVELSVGDGRVFDTTAAAMDDYLRAVFGKVCSKSLKLYDSETETSTTGYPIFIKYYEVRAFAGEDCSEKTMFRAFTMLTLAASCPPDAILLGSGSELHCQGPSKPTISPLKSLGKPAVCEGNPCDVATGNKYQAENDYSAPNAGGLSFSRYYNSGTGTWRHTYERTITRKSLTSPVPYTMASAQRADGKVIDFFEDAPGVYVPSPDLNERLVAQYDASKKIVAWELKTEDDATERYDADGKLLSISTVTGLKQSLTYELINGKSAIKSVKDAFGRSLNFVNDSSGRVKSVKDPVGNEYLYAYNALGRLETVTYPGAKVRKYLYNESAFTNGANLPSALTGILDENSKRYATWKYNSSGKAVSSEHAGGVEKVTLNYLAQEDGTHRTEVTDAAGSRRAYSFKVINGAARVTGVDSICDSCADDAMARDYDENGNLTYRLDRRGEDTTWTYDLTRNTELTRTENGSKLTTTEWHDRFRRPGKITQSNLEIKFDYDPTFGTLLQKTATDTETQRSRVWKYTYFDNTRLLKKIDGPRIDVNDETTFTYDVEGNMSTVTNALGHVTRFELFDKNGRPGSVTDANGLVTLMTYDGRGNLKTRKVGQELTTFGYDNVGQLTTLTLPSMEVITYTYDDAHRLIDIKKSSGEHMHFTLDASGNRKKIEQFDSGGVLTFSNSAEFDQYNRMRQYILAGGQTTTMDTDENGQLSRVLDPLGRETLYRHENGKLKETTYADNSTVKQEHDDLDQLVRVTNAKDFSVTYKVNALGEVEGVDTPDPDAFTRAAGFNSSGNMTARHDYRGILTTHTYDALDRIKSISAPGAVAITYGYDAGLNGKGRLTSMIDESGTTTRAYNSQGRIETVTRLFSGMTFKLRYDYDAVGRLKSITYPSGRVVSYKYEKEQIVGVDINNAPLIVEAKYAPFGSPRSWRWGNGAEYVRETDLNGRVWKYSSGKSERTLKYDDYGNVVEILDSINPQLNQGFGYDDLNRVSDYFTGAIPALQEHYDYDAAGNRTVAIIAGRSYSYGYLTGSDFLLSVAGPIPRTWRPDATGSSVSDGTHVFKLNSYRSIASSAVGGVRTEYLRNGFQQRVTKSSTDGKATHFVYDEAGQILAEVNKSGATIAEHIWLGQQPIAVVSAGVTNYVFADHLNTPRMVTDQTNRVRWTWHSNPFGSTPDANNPSGLGVFGYALRFPGQYFDAESGYHYNYHRFYDPQTGRYIQSDPIGLEGGINTYGYVDGNPVSSVDPEGLQSQSNFFAPVDGGHGPASVMPKGPTNDVYGHGSYKGMWRGPLPDQGPGGGYMTAKELADYMKEQPGYDPNKPAALYGCGVGVGSYCQQVANRLGTDVSCYDGPVWYWKKSGWFSDTGQLGSYGKSFPNGKNAPPVPDYSRPGNLITRHPKTKGR